MKYSKARDELRELLDQLMDGEHDIETLVTDAMDSALRQCQVRKGKHEQAKRLMKCFWRNLRTAQT